ncbi:MAG: hypothetical protein ACREQY_17570 [Candidatus Binatia bacterium]
MRLVCANHSSYPRVAEGPRGQRVRRAYTRRERGEIDDAGYAEVVRDYAREVVAEQQDAGCEIVTDGQVGWYDLVSHQARGLDGVRIGGLHRFFDTNYLVRQPEVAGPVSGSYGLADDFAFLAGVTPATPKAVVTGPYTMARHSILTGNGGFPALVAQYAEVTRAEVAALAAAGATLVQIEEPSLLQHPDDAALVRGALTTATAEKGGARVSLVTYFGDAAAVYRELVDMPVDMLGFDLTYSPGLPDLVAAAPPPVPVALGAVDGRNTKLDDTEAVGRVVQRVTDALGAKGIDEVHLQPSCGLEYLPRDRALRKLERMREIAEAASKVGS